MVNYQQDHANGAIDDSLPVVPLPPPALQPASQSAIHNDDANEYPLYPPPLLYNNNANAPINVNVNGANTDADAFGEHKWTGKCKAPFQPQVIGDFKAFCAVALREMDEPGSRLGAKRLAAK